MLHQKTKIDRGIQEGEAQYILKVAAQRPDQSWPTFQIQLRSCSCITEMSKLTMTMFPPLTAIACGTAAATVLVLGLVTAACGGVAAGVAAVVAAVGVAPAN
jgi:hypothetical protein